MTNQRMTLVDWLDDLCVRFIVNLPNEELQSVERICFQIEEAQWFYEDFIRPLDPNNLPSMHLRRFSQLMFQHCPLFSAYSEELHQQAYEQFLAYKTRVPVRGAIMLNQDMTHAVLVKGWKKGAKWSWPRGKINKEEPDLDCAVREVWEETGFDLRETDLVLPDEQMKKIAVTMRDQSMMLYVFRGVPMDTHFEPKTRKEISKVDWYKLTDLPAMRRKNQIQQGPNNDLIKESNFYMVAPFLGPLKSWIKQQHKLDRQQLRNSALLAPPVGITDDEDAQPEHRETLIDDALSAPEVQSNSEFADMIARLGQPHRPSETLPELLIQPTEHSVDPAAELKRLLSVGVGGQPPQAATMNFPTQQQSHANSLLALFHPGGSHPGAPQIPMPHTPFDQMMPPPMEPRSPHGQHHPRAHDLGSMEPPPPFPIPSDPQHQHHHAKHGPPPHHRNEMQMPMSPRAPQSHPQQPSNLPPSAPSMLQLFDQNPQRPVFLPPSNPQSSGPQSGPTIPAASNLPAPKLNAHTLALLNAFKISEQRGPSSGPPSTSSHPRAQHSSRSTPRMLQSLPHQRAHDLSSPPWSHAPSPPQFRSQPVNLNFEPEQPKPRTAHQDSLLSLFSVTPPVLSSLPAELSAHSTTPGRASGQAVANPTIANPSHLNLFRSSPKPADITTATVSGSVDAPDFDTARRNTQQSTGTPRGPSPAMQTPFMPQRILKRAKSNITPRSPAGLVPLPHNGMSQSTGAISVRAENTFHPQILKRPQQPHSGHLELESKPSAHALGLLNMLKGASPQPAPAQPSHPELPTMTPPANHGPESAPKDQKLALLALFGNQTTASPQSDGPAAPARSSLAPASIGTLPNYTSPVSPLPPARSQSSTPAGLVSGSTTSSVGAMPVQGGLAPPAGPAASAQGRRTGDGKSPVDKAFLLGFLDNVARQGR